MGRSSQRKGRANELALGKLLERLGFDVRVHDQWEELDITVNGVPSEVKVRANGFTEIYKAADAGAGIFFCRADRKPWLMLTISVVDSSLHSDADLFKDGERD